jgi:DNA-binding response OmpR family regulator
VSPRTPILIVEDDPGIADMIAMALQNEGYAVVVAPNGARAIDLLEIASHSPTPIRLMVLDMLLPGITGIGVLHHLTKLTAPASVLAISASPAALQAARDLGVQSMLRKPFELSALLEVVKGICC